MQPARRTLLEDIELMPQHQDFRCKSTPPTSCSCAAAPSKARKDHFDARSRDR
jgi:hypothetical protein